MNARHCILAALATSLLLPALARGDEMDQLKQRFKQRYAALLDLRQNGKVGEMYNGLAGAVKKEYLDDAVKEKNRKQPRTLKAFLAEENNDRIALCKLIAKQTGTSARSVAKHNAKRNFKKAADHEYLKLTRDGAWKQKKDLDP